MRNALILASVIGAFAFSALPLAGCGDDGSGGAGGGTGGTGGTGGAEPTVEEACAAVAVATCAQIDTCAPFLMQVTYGAKGTCEERTTERCTSLPELEGSKLTVADLQACAAAYEARTCAEVLDPAPAGCRFPGEKADGEACVAGSQCTGLLCLVDVEGTCGECATPLADGDPCDPAKSLCGEGLFCASGAQVCTKLAQLDQPCTDQKVCRPGLSCNEGKCGAQLPEGAACGSGEICDLVTGVICFLDTCTQVDVVAVGKACGFDQDTGQITTCDADLKCEQEACVARPKEGEACTVNADTGNGDCISGFDCVAGKCSAAYPTCK